MREIKFRAWLSGGGDPRIKPFMIESDPFPLNFWKLVYEWDLKVDLMQYTGLKDKNGVEVCEGDVVSSDKFYPSEIVYSDSQACFLACDLIMAEGECYQFHERWEVIGNSLQNPELLERSK